MAESTHGGVSGAAAGAQVAAGGETAIVYLDGSTAVAEDDTGTVDSGDIVTVLESAIASYHDIMIQPGVYESSNWPVQPGNNMDRTTVRGSPAGLTTSGTGVSGTADAVLRDTSGTFPKCFDVTPGSERVNGAGFRHLTFDAFGTTIDLGGNGVMTSYSHTENLYFFDCGDMLVLRDPIYQRHSRLMGSNVNAGIAITTESGQGINAGNSYFEDLLVQNAQGTTATAEFNNGITIDGSNKFNYIVVDKIQTLGNFGFATILVNNGATVEACEFYGIDVEGGSQSVWLQANGAMNDCKMQFQRLGKEFKTKSDANNFDNNEIWISQLGGANVDLSEGGTNIRNTFHESDPDLSNYDLPGQNKVVGADRVYWPTNREALSANKTLAQTDPPYQTLDPGGSNRDVNLPAEERGLWFYIANNASGANEDLVIKNDAGTTLVTANQDDVANVWSDGTGWAAFKVAGDVT